MQKYTACVLFLLLFAACSPSTPADTDSPSFTQTANPSPTTQVISPSVKPSNTAPVDTNLPPECRYYDPSIDPVYYSDFSDGACDHPAISVDGSQVAYTVPVKLATGKVVYELHLHTLSTGQTQTIYTSRCGILHPQWSMNGFLVISDSPQDVGCGFTVVYDPTTGALPINVEGAAFHPWADSWNPDHSAFFTLSPEDFGPVCDETLTGVGLTPPGTAPAPRPDSEETAVSVVVGQPVWSENGKTLFAVLRDGACASEGFANCIYTSAYVVSINFLVSPPAVSVPYRDPTLDFSIQPAVSGGEEVISAPTVPMSCVEISEQESQ